MDASRDAKGLGHGQGYVYPHDREGHWAPQQYLPTSMLGTTFYKPGDLGYEAEVRDRVKRWREAQAKALADLKKEAKES
jgi:putative ATPase